MDKFTGRVLALHASNANGNEWESLARELLNEKHRIEGALEAMERTVARQRVRISELETALDAAQLHIGNLEDILGDQNTHPGVNK